MKKILIISVCALFLFGIVVRMTSADNEYSGTVGNSKIEMHWDILGNGSLLEVSCWAQTEITLVNIEVTGYTVDAATGEVRASGKNEWRRDDNFVEIVVRPRGGSVIYKGEVRACAANSQYGGITLGKKSFVLSKDSPKTIPTTTPVPTAAPTNTPTPLPPTMTPTPMVYPATGRIIWQMSLYNYMTPEDQLEVNRILYEKGFDCAVDFIPVGIPFNNENVDKIQDSIERGEVPDILFTGYWDNNSTRNDIFRDEKTDYSISGWYSMLKQYYLPLDEYLTSNKGKALRDCFSDVAWDSASVNGTIFTVPQFAEESGVYLLVQNEYANMFDSYDGSYEKLREIYESVGRKDMRIVIPKVDQRLVNAFLGYDSYNQFTFDGKNKQFVTFADNEQAIALWKQLYDDISGKIVGDHEIGDSLPLDDSHIFAEVIFGKEPSKEGFTVITLRKPYVDTTMVASFGIYKNSANTELALRVFTECLSNPEIYAIMCKRYTTPEDIVAARAQKEQRTTGDLTGFVPELSEEQWKVFLTAVSHFETIYQPDYFLVINEDGIYRDKQIGSGRELNPDFSVDSWFLEFHTEEIADLVAEMNRQYAEYQRKR